MKAYKSTLVLLVAAAVLANFMLIPGKKEQALIFLKEGRFNEAEKIYETLLAEGSLNRNYLTPLTKIYIGRGDAESAIQVHEQYLTENREDIEVWERLFELYTETLKPYRLMDALERVVARFPDVKYYEQLIGLYEELGVGDDRYLTALQKIVELDSTRKADTEKLIFALAQNGQVIAASMRLDTYVEQFQEQVDQNVAELRLRLLLSSGRDRAAYAWSKKWLSNHENLSMRYMALLHSKGLSGNLNTAMASSEVSEFYGMPSWLIDMFMGQDWIGRDVSVLNKFVARLDKEKLHNYPVIMASLALKQHDHTVLKKWLSIAESRNDLTSRQQADLILVYLKINKVSKAMTLLSTFTEKDDIPSTILAKSVKHILKTNRVNEAMIIFQTLLDNQKDKGVYDSAVISESWVLLASAAGEISSVSEWIESNGDDEVSVEVLSNIYYAAADRSNFKLASVVGRLLYSRTQNTAEAQLLIESLLGLKNKNLEEKSELISLLNTESNKRNQSNEDRRALAFQLLRQGEKKSAIKQFKYLAKNQGPDGVDVKQLLFLWGGAPDESGLNWLQARATTSPDNELSDWWRYLIQTGGIGRVLAMGNSMNRKLPLDAEKTLLNAYVEVKDFSGLDQKLKALAENTSSKKQLELFAEYANGAGLAEVEETIWKRLFDVKPTHIKAIRELGVAAFDRGDLLNADDYLSQYLKLTKGDWQTTLYLGDISLAFDRHTDAQMNYQKSLALIDDGIGDGDFSDGKMKNITRAYLLNQLGKKKETITVYEKLIASYPNDPELIAKYSDFLINEGQLDRARKLLAGIK